eukprot:CAMPEP_0196579380 /NCGR_PEP_ID=MMETSP1081-20130531/21154_1 /TAXON_ID=36882 /ORGANISM="Pyramimonas amylifera, Strain CCMP720" /LENGTH=208 /DNA_ID=CAMNT_0041898945 /DNA_START=115 /DNA_END=741 /DNA_ORIENTATION=-
MNLITSVNVPKILPRNSNVSNFKTNNNVLSKPLCTKLSSKNSISLVGELVLRSLVHSSRPNCKVTGFPGTFASLSTGGVPITIQGKNVEVTDAIKEYAEEKIGHAVAQFEASANVKSVDIKFSTSGGNAAHGSKSQLVEVTVYTKSGVFRAEEEESSIYAGIDLCADKVSRKLRKTKEKTVQHKGNLSTKEVAAKLDGEFDVASEDEE